MFLFLGMNLKFVFKLEHDGGLFLNWNMMVVL